MSRRKQARPKSCKLEGMVEKRQEEAVPPVSDSPSRSAGALWTKDSADEEDGTDTPGQKTSNKQVTGQGSPHGPDSVSCAGTSSPVFRCDTCGAVFNTLDHFMDHRNFVCTTGTKAGLSWSAQDKPEWSGSDSGSVSPRPPTLEEGVALPLPLHLTEDQLPFAIGISEANPFGCQYCEKAFPQTNYLLVHERVHSDQLPFSCEHCQRLFRDKRQCERHARLHVSDKKMKCNQCSASFTKKEDLKAHLRKHESSKLFQCPICQSGFASALALTSHLATHQDPEGTSAGFLSAADLSTCTQCGQSFETMQLLQEHMSIHSAVIKVEKVCCEICSQQFSSQDALDSHMEQTHFSNPQPMDLDPSSLLLKCPMCPLSFPDTLSLCQHLMTHTATSMTLTTDLDPAALVRGSKDMLEVSPKKDGSRSHTPKRSASTAEISPGGSRLSKTPQALVCPYCLSDSFDSLEVLELHMQSMHSVKSNEIYTCNYCNAPYPNLYSLHDHMNVVHRNHPGIGIKYPCSLCNNQFPSIEALAKHKSLSHSYQDSSEVGHSSGIDSAFCGQCSLTFPTARQLEDHMVSVHGASVEKKTGKTRGRKPMNKGNKENKHTSSKHKTPRLAALSAASSSSSSSADTMTSTTTASPARTPAPVESITCDECNATFHELANFQAHMKLHLDAALAKFTCKKCGQQLGSQEQLEAHLSLHYLCLATEYGCTSCMKLFSKPDELQKHLMDIHAHHLYRCALCKEIFDSKVNIQVHFAIKHSNECKLFKCTQCPNIFRSEMEWQVHVRVNHLHLAKPYRCLFCAESFTSEMELQCHLTTHSKPFRCPMCEQAFHIEYLLDQHMQTEHADADTKAAVAALLSPSSTSVNSISIKEEADSSTSVTNSITLTRSPRPSSQSSDPRKSVSPAVLQPSVSPLGISMLSSAVWKNSEAVHVCNICDSRFTQQSLLAIHKVQEHGLKAGSSSLSPPGKGRSSSASPSTSFTSPVAHSQAAREKFLQQNQTLVSVLSAETQSHPMACTFCSQTFRNQTECDKHMKIHANSTSLKCNICDETFPSGSTLAEHKLQHCKIQQGNICFVCKLPLKTEEQFYSHAQEHGYQGSLLQCIVCRQTLASVVELQMHGKHHYQLRPSFYTCCVCLKTFHSKENLVSKLNSSGRTYYVCKPCYHGESPLHTCPQCSEKFASKAQLDAHAATHNVTAATAAVPSKSSSALAAPQTYQCIKCQESFSTEYEIQLHVANHMLQEGTAHECKLCTLVFESPAKLQCHLIEHTYKDEAEIRCTICDKVFSSAAEIQVHALDHGIDGRGHTCGQCSQRFFFSAELDNHVLIYNHSPATPSAGRCPQQYECPDCSKVFTSAAALSNHSKTHERNENAIRCSLCPQTFGNILLMQQHFLISHMGAAETSTGEKGAGKEVYSCTQCKLQFPTAESLQMHMGSAHKRESSHLSCPICSKSFSHTKLLTLHLRSHSDSKPFSCSVCQKRFSREENLKSHMKSHSVLPPLVCPLCSQSFTQRADITEHLKTHFSASEDQENHRDETSPQDTNTAASSDASMSAVVNGSRSPDLESSSTKLSETGMKGLRAEGTRPSVELVVPDPQQSPSNGCKLPK